MKIILIFLIVLLQACAPTSYVYVKSQHNNNNSVINKVVIIVESLSLKDDLRGYWNFDEDINLSNQDELLLMAQQALLARNYKVAHKQLLSSGLIMHRDFLADHYLQGKKQDEPISAPYILRSINLLDEEIIVYEDLLAELNRPISPAMKDLRSFVVNNYKAQTAKMGLTDDTAILLIQSYQPKASLFSNVDIGISTSSSGNGGFVGFGGNNPRPTSYAYLIHVRTGDLLWSNKTTLIKANNWQKFFNELPNATLFQL